MRKNVSRFGLQKILFLCMEVFLLLILITTAGESADPSSDYPSRPISYITTGGPGSNFDVMGRLLGDIIVKEKLLNQPLIIQNRQGSGGTAAFGFVFEKKGNPYIILAVGTGSFIVTPLREKLPYTYKSFIPICNLTVDGNVLVVKSDSLFKSVDDIIIEARKRPRQLTQGGASFGSNESIMGMSIQKLKGVQWNFLSFKSESEAALNVLNGNADFSFIAPTAVIDHVHAGKLRILLAAAPKRFQEFKDIPTTKEVGLGEPIVTYRGIVGPPNMPGYAAKKLEEVFRRTWNNDRFQKYIKESMMQPYWLPSGDQDKLLDMMHDRWKGWLSEYDLLKKK